MAVLLAISESGSLVGNRAAGYRTGMAYATIALFEFLTLNFPGVRPCIDARTGDDKFVRLFSMAVHRFIWFVSPLVNAIMLNRKSSRAFFRRER